VAPPRELFLSEKDQCKLLRFTSEVAKVTDAFCSGDIATILDTFLELGGLPTTTALISTACSEAATRLMGEVADRTNCSGVLRRRRLSECPAVSLCEDQVSNIKAALVPDFSINCAELAADGADQLQAMFEEQCVAAAEEVMAQLQAKAEEAAASAETQLKKKYPKTTKKAQGTAEAICTAAPIVGGLVDTVYDNKCIDVKTDLFIACANMANYKWFPEVEIYTPADYGYAADFGLMSEDASSWSKTWLLEKVERARWRVDRDEELQAAIAELAAEYRGHGLSDEDAHDLARTFYHYQLAAAGFHAETKDMNIEEIWDDEPQKTKLVQAEMYTKGAEPNFCKYTTTYSFDSELAVAQIVDKISSTTKLNKIFTKDLTDEEFAKFHKVADDACGNGEQDFQSWFQLSDQFEGPLDSKLHMCISYVVTTEDRIDEMSSAATSYSLGAVTALVATAQLLLAYA
jgi:hypothetical protein